MAGARFRYVLEPVAVQRQWAVDEVQRELALCNTALAERRAACAVLEQQLERAELHWRMLGAGQRLVTADQFALAARYLAERNACLQEAQQALAQQQTQCDQMLEQLLMAQRALDAVEEHKTKMKAQFVQQRLSGEFKVADEQWNVLRAGEAEHGN